MKLYYHPLSTYSQKVLIALYEKGLQFDGEMVQLFDPAVREEYRAIYPMGKIPCLFDDDDHMVPESSIIIEYLDARADPRLISSDPDIARKTRFKDRMYDLYLLDPVATLLFQSMKPEADRDDERIAIARQRVSTMYMFMDSELGNQPFSSGSEFSLSDCAAAAGLFYAPKVAAFDDHPNITAYWQRLCERPSIQQVHAEAAPYVEEFEKKNAA